VTKAERETLVQICRMRARVAKAEATTIAAQRKADFQAQLAAIYHFDNDAVWKKAHAAARDATWQAQEQIAQRCRDLGIPGSFASEVSMQWWGRERNSSSSWPESTATSETAVVRSNAAPAHALRIRTPLRERTL
jgi:hypothetical protein